jgi:ATP-binding cassette subfamily C exporter for protease/lipase
MQNKKSLMKPNKLFSQLARTYKQELLLALVFSSVANIMMLVPTLYMLQIYDRVMISKSEITLVVVSIITFGLMLTMGFAEWARSKVLIAAGVNLELALSQRLFRVSFLNRLKQTQKSTLQPFNDLAQLRQTLTGQSIYALLDAPWTPFYIVIMFLLHPWLGYLSLVFCVNLTLVAWFSAQMTKDSKDQSLEEETELNRFVHSKLRNAEVIEAHGMANNLKLRWWQRQVEVLKTGTEAENLESKLTSATKEITILKQSLALGVGALLVMEGELTVGAMIAANLLMTRATAPLDMMVNGWRGFKQSFESAKRLEELFDEFPEEVQRGKSHSLKGAIELQNISVKVATRKTPILHEVSLQVRPGEAIAVVGASGSGKSTLAKVILGIWPSFAGQVSFDGVDIHEIDREFMGPQVGYLAQDVELFDGTIAENIARMSEVDHERVILAAQHVGMHETILHLPSGYDHQITGKGGALSSGQKQRVALARAIYGTPQILILDEPDSSLDEAGVNALEEVLKELKSAGTTIVLITHRESMLAFVDRIVEMKSGQISNTRDVQRDLPNAQAKLSDI